MSTTAIILNIVFATAVIFGIVGSLAWAILTQHRNDPGYIAAVRQDKPRKARADVAPRSVRQPIAWPAA